MAVDPAYLDAILGPTTKVRSRVDIFESDGTTLFQKNVRLINGSVSVDQGRSERRSFSLELLNQNGELDNYPGGFWYDKIIKPYRGVKLPDGTEYESRLGEFVIDNIDTPDFPSIVSVSGRDYTKKLVTSKFAVPTSFAQGASLETVIKNIALNGGISRFILPNSGKTLGRSFLFDRGVPRWEAINELATAYNYEVYFDRRGYMVMDEPQDPVTSPEVFTFKTGGTDGSLSTFRKRTSDTRIYNFIAVEGQSAGEVPIYAEAKNTEPSSPTRIDKIGERVFLFKSAFITTQAQAQEVANSFLKIHALEQFDISFDSLVIPWLEAGQIIKFIDPSPNPGDPTRFLFSSFTIPLGLGTMSSVAKRVTIVG